MLYLGIKQNTIKVYDINPILLMWLIKSDFVNLR